SDIFSLGAIIFQLITGHHPYEADSEEAMIDKIKKNQDPSHRPTTKMILSHDTVLMSFRLFGGLQQSKQEKIDSLNERNRLQDELNRERIEKERTIAERDQVIDEKNRLQVENDKEKRDKEKAILNKDKQKRKADLAVTEKDRLQFELNRERTEKDQVKRRADLAVSELDIQKTKTNESQELVRVFQQQVETTQSEVTNLTTENQHLRAELSRREILPSTAKAQVQQMPFVQPDAFLGVQIGQSSIVPKPSSKQQPISIPKLQQIQQSVTSSAQTITVNLQVPSEMHGHKDRNRFNHDDTGYSCTISTDPIISERIVYYESVFENLDEGNLFAIGIADSSVVFKPNNGPGEDGNKGKTVRYWSHGYLEHINGGPSHQGFVCRYKIGLEVNMISSPRRLTFFVNDVEQQCYVVNIPEAIRFWSYIHDPNSSFRVTRFERRSSSSAHGVTGSRRLEWGKEWPRY
ncbi:MAG: hypothetical protein EZS28_032375, partial [Streblomastix strix]